MVSRTVGDVAVVLTSIFPGGYIVVCCLCHAAIWFQLPHAVHVRGIETRWTRSISYK